MWPEFKVLIIGLSYFIGVVGTFGAFILFANSIVDAKNRTEKRSNIVELTTATLVVDKPCTITISLID